MKVTLREKPNGKLKKSLYLDITGNGQRKKEYLELYLWVKPKDFLQKRHNDETKAQAEVLRANMQLELQAADNGLEYVVPGKGNFVNYFQSFVDTYPNKDINKIKAANKHFIIHTGGKPFALNQKFVNEYRAYLMYDAELMGETPSMYMKIFKRVARLAYKDRVIKTDPDKLDMKVKYDRHAFRKEVLDEADLIQLAKTKAGNQDVKRLFLFCCNTGLRFGDAKALTWKELKGYKIKIEQGKTGRFLYADINDMAKQMAGEPKATDERVFPGIKDIASVQKVIKNWNAKAGLDKHITTHSARHTFCTMLMRNKVDHRTIIGLMGWSEESGMRNLMRYAHLVDDAITEAVNTLPKYDVHD